MRPKSVKRFNYFNQRAHIPLGERVQFNFKKVALPI